MSAENYESLCDHEKRIKDLERKVGNTNVDATLTSDAERITELEEQVSDLITRLDLTLNLIDIMDKERATK